MPEQSVRFDAPYIDWSQRAHEIMVALIQTTPCPYTMDEIKEHTLELINFQKTLVR